MTGRPVTPGNDAVDAVVQSEKADERGEQVGRRQIRHVGVSWGGPGVGEARRQ